MTEEPQTTDEQQDSNNKPVRWRKNVLALFVLAYGSVLILFTLMVGFGVEKDTAAEIVGVPFIALIGGTLRNL